MINKKLYLYAVVATGLLYNTGIVGMGSITDPFIKTTEQKLATLKAEISQVVQVADKKVQKMHNDLPSVESLQKQTVTASNSTKTFNRKNRVAARKPWQNNPYFYWGAVSVGVSATTIGTIWFLKNYWNRK